MNKNNTLEFYPKIKISVSLSTLLEQGCVSFSLGKNSVSVTEVFSYTEIDFQK